jgi:hypothetical protein
MAEVEYLSLAQLSSLSYLSLFDAALPGFRTTDGEQEKSDPQELKIYPKVNL